MFIVLQNYRLFENFKVSHTKCAWIQLSAHHTYFLAHFLFIQIVHHTITLLLIETADARAQNRFRPLLRRMAVKNHGLLMKGAFFNSELYNSLDNPDKGNC